MNALKTRKVPLRKCLATGEMCPKKDLVRIVKNNHDEIFVDTTSKANGHGAYLKKSKEAIDLAKKTNCLGKALEAEIPEEIYTQLYELVK